MIDRVSRFLWAGLLTASFPFGQAVAAVMTYDVSFSANTFQVGSGPDPAPADPVNGSFQITLDTAVDATNQTAGISLDTLNIALGSALSFNYISVTDRLEVGGLNNGANSIIFTPSTNDFWLFINDFTSGTPLFDQVGYTQTSVSSNNLFYTINQTGSATVTAVPVPGSLALMLSGWLAFRGVASRRRTA